MGGTYRSVSIAENKKLEVGSAVLTLTGQPAGARAVGVLTLTGNAVADETVTIGSTVYTWKATVGAAFTVAVGGTASISIDNLIAAVNAAAGAGSLYGTGTTVHPTVRAAAGAGDTMDVRANLAGTAGNSIATTETMTNGSFGGANLSGGVAPETFTADGVAYSFVTALPEAGGPPNPTVINEVLIGAAATNTLDNLIAAGNGAAGAGTTYATGTVAQDDLVFAAGTGDTMDITPKKTTAATRSLTLAEAIANGSLNRTVMADGSFYSLPIPISASPYLGIQLEWDATVAFSAAFETTNIRDEMLANDSATGTKWFNETGVTLTTPGGGSAATSMKHLSSVASRRARLKVTPTVAGFMSCWAHGKD
jgi:hypothetical protein